MTSKDYSTLVVRDDVEVPEGFQSLVRPTFRGSTIVFDTAEAFLSRGAGFFDGYTYGLAGTPTYYALARRLAEIEKADHCVLSPSGLGAIHLVNQTVLKTGDHVLIPRSAYGPTQKNASALLERFGVKVTIYDPLIASGIEALIEPDTRLIWLESPGSLTMEIQDVPAIVSVARRHRIATAIDNTWATPIYFDALGHGVDYSVQALTKYVAGHSDLLMGAVCVNGRDKYEALRTTADLMGSHVSPDDCVEVMRGLGTMMVRLARHENSALQVAKWLDEQPAVDRVLFPGLPTDPGHALWSRDFSGSTGLMSFTLKDAGFDDACRFVNKLKLFYIGASWGGIHSLVAIYSTDSLGAAVARTVRADHLIRIHVGLEGVEDLLEDLQQALSGVTEAFSTK
ncbi:Cystathionine beta-lyase [Bordetella sputigena]|uniref:cystathionine beta-lyase n=1 Tax=Bordetella sputigena TaxID=1416810 RepID=UPI0039EE5F2A